MNRRILTITLGLCLFMAAYSQEMASIGNTSKTEIEWQTLSKDVGQLKQDTPIREKYKYTNNGLVPLVIENVKTSCGCTVGDYSKEPLMPGESAEITVSYDTHRVGKFQKTITVYSNSTEAVSVLTIRGEILQ